MPREIRRACDYRLVVPAIGLAVLITALVAMASGAPQLAVAADQALKAAQITWAAEPTPAPATPFTDASGAEKTLADFKGKALVVNFWATWCAPCIKEMPTLDALQAKLGGTSFQVVAVSQDREGEKVARPFMEKQGWKNIGLYTEPPGHFARDAKLRGLPTTIIIDKQGREVARVEGEANWTAADVENALRKLMTAP